MLKRLIVVGCVLLVAAGGVWVERRLRRPANNPLEAGQCTWYAVERASEDGWAIKFDQPYGRHAKFWPERVVGAELVTTPAPGQIMVLDAWPGNEYGHVAYVEKVKDANHWTISHANMLAGSDERTLDGVTIRRSEITRHGSKVSFDGGRGRFRLTGFLARSTNGQL